ncbi:MAG: PQQ-like beta-propeller repeat protein [Polyangiaceae bacterium]|nr:PQQ-like beta-propeller repeat protein [Polyangiaceae bacterium]
MPESAILPGGDLVLGGVASPVEHFYDLTGYYSQPLVVRLTPSGQEVWRVTLPATNDAYVNSMVVGADGTIYLAGSFSGELTAGATTLTSSGVDALVVALSVNGEVLWAKQFGNGAAQRAWHLAMDGTGDLIIGGPFMGTIDFGGGLLSATNGEDIFLARLDASGEHIASRAIDDAEYDTLWSLDVASDGTVLIGAEHTEDFMVSLYVAAYAPDLGVELWRTDTNMSEPQVRARADGTLVTVGSYLQMLHLDEGGAQISAVSYDAGTFGLLYPRLAVTPDGLNCVTGAALSTVDLGTGPLTPRRRRRRSHRVLRCRLDAYVRDPARRGHLVRRRALSPARFRKRARRWTIRGRYRDLRRRSDLAGAPRRLRGAAQSLRPGV